MQKWYVKARQQTDHAERASLLGCDLIIEDTSSQVNPETPLPHVIVQTITKTGFLNTVFVEPVSADQRAVMDRLKDVETL